MMFSILRAMKPVVLIILLVSFVAGPALPRRSWTGLAEAASHKVPPGQLTRKSLVGTVTAMASDGSLITIGTRFGDILVGVTGNTVVNIPPDKDVGIGAVSLGDKVVVKLNRSPLEKVAVTQKEEETTATDTGSATTTDSGSASGDTGAATTTDTGAASGDAGNATTTENSATTTVTGAAIPAEASTDPVAVAIAVLGASNAGEGLIGLGGLGIGGIALHGVVLQVATTTAATTATTTDTGTSATSGTATTTDTGTATTTDTGTATTTEAEPAIFEPEVSDVADLPPFRTVTASRITVIKSTRSHKRAIVTCETENTLEVVGDDGVVIELEDESASEDQTATSTEPVAAAIASLRVSTAGTGLIAVGGYGIGGISVRGVILQVATTTISTDGQTCKGGGDDLILLTRKKGRNSKELVIKAKQSSDKIDERLSRIAAKLESSGKGDRLAQFTARAEERAKKEAERLQRTLDRSSESRKKDIEGALNKRKDLNEKPIKDRRPPKRDSGSVGDRGGQSQGGGGGQDKDKDDDKDKGKK